jgi:hypothetical protein
LNPQYAETQAELWAKYHGLQATTD